MGGLIALFVIFLVGTPIVGVIMTSGLGSRISDLEKSIAQLKDKITSLDHAIRHGGDETADFPRAVSLRAASLESSVPPHESVERTVEEAPVHGEKQEILTPSPYALEKALAQEEKPAAPPDIPRIPEEIEALNEDLHETPPAADIPPPPPDMPETDVPTFAALGANEAHEPAAAERSWFEEKCRALLSWLLAEGNIWVTVGMMLFLAGFGLLFSYVHRRGWIPLELRLTGAAVVGIAMTALGWRLRELRRTYALILQGGGIGVLYIVLVAGTKLGPVIPMGGAVVGMLLLSAFTIVLALYQEFEPLALFALLGGYAAPILVSAGSQNFVALFSIHSLLNYETLLISLFRDWRKTRWGGLLASLATGVAWGALRWNESYFASVEPFLILFYINYSAIAMIPLFSERLENALKHVRFRRYERMDMPMTVTVPFAFVFLQMAAASHTRYWVALTCLAVGALHLAFGMAVTKSARAREAGASSELFLVYCMIFSNLAIPFTFQQASASAIWAAEAAFLIAFAVRKNVGYALVSGLLLHAAAFVIYNYGPYLHLPAHIYGIAVRPAGLMNWRDETSPFLLTGLIFAVSALVSSRFMSEAPDRLTPPARILDGEFTMPSLRSVSHFFAAYGTVWWTLSVWHAAFVAFKESGVTAFSILCLGGAAGYALSSYRGWRANGVFGVGSPPATSNWDAAGILAFPPLAAILFVSLLWPISASVSLRYAIDGLGNMFLNDPWRSYVTNWPAFIVMFALGALSYRSASPTRLRAVTWGILLFTFVSYTAVAWQFWVNAAFPQIFGNVSDLAAFLPLFAATGLLTLKRFDRAVAMGGYLKGSRAALCLMMLFRFPAFVESFSVILTPYFSFYVPLLNALELRQFLYLTAAAMLLGTTPNERVRRIGLHYALPFVTFLLLNNVAARSALYYFGERVSFGYMSRAPYFQGMIAILWGVASLGCIFGGKRYGSRPLWFMGAGLLALDILKLLAIDLRNSATVIRIFAFLLLGGFFLLIGWAAPLPPANARTGKRNEREM